nr:NAD(P)H-dependent oxidoreductase [Flavobacterium sp. MDT1-60]
MKNLIIYAHPDPASLNHFFKQTVLESLEKSEDEVILRDLNEINFNPVLSLEDMNGQRIGKVTEDVQVEQDFITWADRIILFTQFGGLVCRQS